MNECAHCFKAKDRLLYLENMKKINRLPQVGFQTNQPLTKRLTRYYKYSRIMEAPLMINQLLMSLALNISSKGCRASTEHTQISFTKWFWLDYWIGLRNHTQLTLQRLICWHIHGRIHQKQLQNHEYIQKGLFTNGVYPTPTKKYGKAAIDPVPADTTKESSKE